MTPFQLPVCLSTLDSCLRNWQCNIHRKDLIPPSICQPQLYPGSVVPSLTQHALHVISLPLLNPGAKKLWLGYNNVKNYSRYLSNITWWTLCLSHNRSWCSHPHPQSLFLCSLCKSIQGPRKLITRALWVQCDHECAPCYLLAMPILTNLRPIKQEVADVCSTHREDSGSNWQLFQKNSLV